MKLVTFLHAGQERTGALTADETAVHVLPYADMDSLIRAERKELDAAVQAAETLPLSEVTLLAPIPRPRQDVICLGINYHAHAEEAARYSAESFTTNRVMASARATTAAVIRATRTGIFSSLRNLHPATKPSIERTVFTSVRGV